MGMIARGDRDHDIATWFGVNQGRIPDVKDGSKFGTVAAAPANELPPKGPPGIKGLPLGGFADFGYVMRFLHLVSPENGWAGVDF